MGKMSRQKGKGGERELAQLLRGKGFSEARRGVQYQGGPDSPDVVGVPGWHIECKRTERLQLYPALAQATLERPINTAAVVLHRANGKPWVAIMDAEDFFALLRR